MTQIFEKISKPKCDFGATAAAQNKAMNWFLLCSERSETQLKTTIHCHLSWCSLPLTRPDGDEPSVKSIQEQLYYNKSYYSRQTENKWTSCEVTDKLSNEPLKRNCIRWFTEKPFPIWQPRVEAKQILVLPLGKVTEGSRLLAGREKIPVIPTHEVKVLQLFVCYTPTRRGVIKNNPRIYHSLGTGLSGSSDSRTSWCRQ